MANEQFSQQADAVLSALRRDLQAFQYEASRAQKQFDAADPENRLVTEALERRWNVALCEVQRLEQRIAERQNLTPQQVDVKPGDFAGLAGSIEQIWNRGDTNEQLKKRVVRTLIREIVVELNEAAGETNLVIHWQGGIHTKLMVPRRRRGEGTATSPVALDAVRALARVCADEKIAGVLN